MNELLDLLYVIREAMGAGQWGFVAGAALYVVIELLRGEIPGTNIKFGAPWVDHHVAQGMVLFGSILMSVIVVFIGTGPEAVVAAVGTFLASFGIHDSVEALHNRVAALRKLFAPAPQDMTLKQ